jgi:hypothetical protein
LIKKEDEDERDQRDTDIRDEARGLSCKKQDISESIAENNKCLAEMAKNSLLYEQRLSRVEMNVGTILRDLQEIKEILINCNSSGRANTMNTPSQLLQPEHQILTLNNSIPDYLLKIKHMTMAEAYQHWLINSLAAYEIDDKNPGYDNYQLLCRCVTNMNLFQIDSGLEALPPAPHDIISGEYLQWKSIMIDHSIILQNYIHTILENFHFSQKETNTTNTRKRKITNKVIASAGRLSTYLTINPRP